MSSDIVLRTPDERFGQLPDFPWTPRYLASLRGFEGLRMHYVDEGARDHRRASDRTATPVRASVPPSPPEPSDQVTFLCLHGEPTWSYLYRRMVPIFLARGYRVVAPDLFGFGRSDKPQDESVYTFDFHRRALLAFVEALDLRNVALVCQDWGGLLGLTVPVDLPGRFTRALLMNTMLATGDEPLSPGFLAWRGWVAHNPDLSAGKLLGRACPHLRAVECAAYDAPFPDARYKAGVRRFPQLVPDRADAPGAAMSRRAREFWSQSWQGDSFMAIGMTDPVLGGPVMHALRRHIRGCPPPLEIAEGGHFLQEWGERVAQAAVAHFFGGDGSH